MEIQTQYGKVNIPPPGIGRDGHVKNHDQIRHCPFETNPKRLDYGVYNKNSAHQFPSDWKSGDLTKLKKFIIGEYWRSRKGIANNVRSIDSLEDNVMKLCVKVPSGDVKVVYAYISSGRVLSVYPIKGKGKIKIKQFRDYLN